MKVDNKNQHQETLEEMLPSAVMSGMFWTGRLSCFEELFYNLHTLLSRLPVARMASDSFEAKAIASSSCLDSAHHLFRAPRVSQIDCEDLDEGLVSILGEKVLRSLGNFRVG
jgi:hypothetical protein